MQDIYLSPNYDDIAFSISSFIKPGGMIIDVCTTSDYVENMKYVLPVSNISEIRKNEEKLFSLQNKLNFISLDFIDKGMIGKPFSYSYNIAKDKILEKLLIEKIKSITEKNIIKNIYCPLGVGKHYNHLQIFNIIQDNYEKLQKNLNIIFYAEAPYLFYKNNFNNRKRKLNQWFKKHHLEEYKKELNSFEIQQKINNLHNYESQFNESSDINISSKISNKQAKFFEIIYY